MPNTQSRSRARAQRGVSLFEVLIVIALMAMIASTVAIAVLNHSEHAKRHHAETAARTIRSAAKLWWLDHDSADCPKVEDLFRDGTLERGSSEKDPWGGAWSVQCSGQDVTVTSNGSDKLPGTADDIRVPPPENTAQRSSWRHTRQRPRGAPPTSRLA